MKFERTDMWGFGHAIRGMRNPLASWNKSDSYPMIFDDDEFSERGGYFIGENDMKLAQRLIKAGPEHRKFLRQIFVSVDITAPLYWWKEFDTYKVGTTANSTSTMHKLASTPITMECFECDDLVEDLLVYENEPYNENGLLGELFQHYIETLETLRWRFNETKDKRYWKELVRLLPESWLQTRTVTMSYENLYCVVDQRAGHKLTEWKSFIEWAHTLPYASSLIFIDEIEENKEGTN